MLVLTRRRGEKIKIGPDVTITLVEINGGRSVKIGVEAPREVTINRVARDDRWEPKKSKGGQ